MKVFKCNINLALPADLSAYTNVDARSSTIYLIDEAHGETTLLPSSPTPHRSSKRGAQILTNSKLTTQQARYCIKAYYEHSRPSHRCTRSKRSSTSHVHHGCRRRCGCGYGCYQVEDVETEISDQDQAVTCTICTDGL